MIAKLKSLFTRRPPVFIRVDCAISEYRKIKGQSNATIASMMTDLNINLYIVVNRSGVDGGDTINVGIKDPLFNPHTMDVIFDLNRIANRKLRSRIRNAYEIERNRKMTAYYNDILEASDTIILELY